MENIVIVGTGDHYHRFLAPCFDTLQQQRISNLVATVSISNKEFDDIFEDVKNIVRNKEDLLSDTLNDIRDLDPIVILGHANDFHFRDLKDLVENGFRVMVEKPYAINFEEFDGLKKLLNEYPKKIFLLDSYLLRKYAPLWLIGGLIKKDNFYQNTGSVFQDCATPICEKEFNLNKLREIVGEPTGVFISLLEGEFVSSNLNHRGPHLFDKRRGGGMIQDLFLHMVSPLFVFEDYLGKTDSSFLNGELKVRRCKEFVDLAYKNHGISRENVAETAISAKIVTSSGVQVKISVGKYISKENEKRIVIKGEKGKIDLDMETNILSIYSGDRLVEEIRLNNQKDFRYYPVIRSGLEFFEGNKLFNFDMGQVLLDSQEFSLNVIKKSLDLEDLQKYDSGEEYSEIFGEKLDYLSLGKITSRNYFNEKLSVSSNSFSKNISLVSNASELFPNMNINKLDRKYTNEEFIENFKDAEVGIVGLEPVDEEFLKACKKLKAISKYGVGLNNIDFGACKKYGVEVLWTPGTNRLSVAELTLCFMISSIRNVNKTSTQLKRGLWNKAGGANLSEKTIGIIGVGHVGKRLIELLKPFNCKILINDVIDLGDYPEENNVELVSKERIFRESDIITTHTSLTDITRNLINKETLSLMKPSSFIINTSRGEIVNEEDLFDALKNEKIAGAALDVYQTEPPNEDWLISLDNVICTPHIGGNSKESILAMGFSAIDNLQEFLENESKGRTELSN
ncbi:MAG: Gfo/Idh/MocA family oxidoreductase [Nanoarchaeota archaeon]|nr:Gfo/Idh/MocA family oxidoreductase [Nanoarchaeota archaeon]